jgi:hypothetical protein
MNTFVYYCPKCKIRLNRALAWKNGITWYHIEHKIFRIIEKNDEE